MEKEIYLAGGCFWGMEKLYRSFPGVNDVTVGYANIRDPKEADYKTVKTGVTEARETIRVRYDPAVMPLTRLLEIFFAVVDPTQYHRQAHDIGSQYQSGIYWTESADEPAVLAVCDEIAAGCPGFCTERTPLKNFFPAEEYHQRYLDKNPGGYCHISLDKILELKMKYGKC